MSMHTVPVLTVSVLASICLHRLGNGKLYTHADLKSREEHPYVGVREVKPKKGHRTPINPWAATYMNQHLGHFRTREEARAARERHVISLGKTRQRGCKWPANVQAVGMKWATQRSQPSVDRPTVAVHPNSSAAVDKTLREPAPKITCPGLAGIFGETSPKTSPKRPAGAMQSNEPPAKKLNGVLIKL